MQSPDFLICLETSSPVVARPGLLRDEVGLCRHPDKATPVIYERTGEDRRFTGRNREGNLNGIGNRPAGPAVLRMAPALSRATCSW